MRELVKLLMFAIILSCSGQVKSKSFLETKTMEYFNASDYENLKKDLGFNNSKDDKQYINGDKRLRVTVYEDLIQVVEKSTISPIEVSRGFYKSNKRLKYIGSSFYYFEVGVWKEFNEEGELVKERDFNLPYKFSIEDLKRKMLKEYDVDIMNLEKIFTVDRFVIDTVAYYLVQTKEAAKLTNYLIDGVVGKVLYVDTTFLKQKKGSILDRYLAKDKREKNLYRRYKGKDYTEEEWEAYIKTDEYKKENLSIWDSIFGKKGN